MKIRLPEGNTLAGRPETIVRLMRDDHWTVGERPIRDYMDAVSADVKRLAGAELRTGSPEDFLRSLSTHKLITILED